MRLMIVTAAGIAVSTLAACAPGQSEFSCQGYPDGVSCLSARNVYELTNSRSRITQQDIEAANGPVAGDVFRPLPDADPKLGLAPPVAAGQQAAEPADGVMRVWVGPHATSTGDVTAPNYVYSRVASKAVDDEAGMTRRFEPLKGRSDLTRTFAARPLKAGDVVVTAAPTPPNDRDITQTRPGAPMTTNNVRVAEIYFDSGQATVSTSGRNRLKIASLRLAELEPRSVLVAGFTDRVGSEEANQRLAERRVDAVVKILKDVGVTTEIIDAAQGEPEELNPGPDGTADPNSRKVWVEALDVAPTPKPDVVETGQRTSVINSTTKAEANAAPGDRGLPANDEKPSFLTRWFGGSSTVSTSDPRGCKSCRHPDDHGDNDDDRSGKDHDAGMKH